jgi:hypothetical protein
MKTTFLPKTEPRALPKLLGRIKLSNFLNLREDRFREYIYTVENDLLFKELMYSPDTKKKIISYKRFPETRINRNLCELKEEIIPDRNVQSVQGLIAENPQLTEKIRKLGIEKFQKYFLYNETDLGLKQIASICELSPEETEQVNDFVNSTLIAKEFNYQPSHALPGHLQTGPLYTKIAKIISTGNSNWTIEYFSGNYARGRYVINYKQLYELKTGCDFMKKQFGRIDRLIRKLELINMRKSILYQIIMKIVKTQSTYFTTGGRGNLKLLTQRMLAEQLGVNPGSISRLFNYKSLEVPWGEEKPMRFFLQNKKQLRKTMMLSIISGSDKLPDRIISEKFRQKYGVSLARRTICQYKNELKIKPQEAVS